MGAWTKKAKEAQATIKAYRRLFSTEDGQTVLMDLMKSCHMLNPTIGSDANETFFNEGSRSVVLRILQTVNTTEKELAQLQQQIQRKDLYEEGQ